MKENKEYTFSGLENQISADHLLKGETCRIVGIGNSMTPILKSREAVICEPVTKDTVLKKKDIVLCKVNGHFYLHLINSIKGSGDSETFQIANNHGHVNGWVSRSKIYGKMMKKCN